MPDTPPPLTSATLRLGDLPNRRSSAFAFVPEAALIERALSELDLLGLRKARLTGTLTPTGRADWRLEAQLGATVVQPCAVTLKPVTTRLEEPVARRYLADFTAPEGGETEMPEDDSTEALPAVLDLAALFYEALALALPDYPRAGDAAFDGLQTAAPGVAPMSDEDARPFTVLSGLRDKLEDKDN